MTPTRKFSAVVLAGGRSRRMGREKALLEHGGAPLWQRQRDTLRAAGAAEVFLSVRAEQAWRADTAGFDAQLLDAEDDGGPLLGLAAGLERAAHAHLAVLAVDLPRMEPAWFSALWSACDADVGAVARRPGADGFFEPLAAIYPQALLFPVREALARGEFSLQRVVAAAVAGGRLRVREIAPRETPWFGNWNEPGDLAP